jgi:hypothetical protein
VAGGAPVYIDQYDTSALFRPSLGESAYPYFSFISYATQLEYPYPATNYDAYKLIYYMQVASGIHRFLFCDTGKAVLVDTSLNLAYQAYNTFYLTDAPVADNSRAAYQVVIVPEDRQASSDKVRVRFVHLSPDAGTLGCYMQKADNSKVYDSLPQNMAFASASSYVTLDTAGAYHNQLVFHLFDNTGTDQLITSVPTTPGRSYVVVIQGFKNNQQRQIPHGKNTDGSIKYTNVAITANLRVMVRESY